MLSVEKVYETFLSHDVDFFTGVPDSLLKIFVPISQTILHVRNIS